MIKREMKSIVEDNVLEYARYTITDRAIPSLSDGFKSIHRRIIWSMYLDKLTNDKPRTKSVNAVGSVLRFSPHGDSSVYDASVRLANDSVMHKIIDGKGAFSSVTSRDVYAGASRYTEMRLDKIVEELTGDINKNAVDMVDNYDETRLEPTDLPSTFPMILANPNTGIAVGIASNIPSFNLNDIIDNTMNILKGKETFPMYPDFPTFGNVVRDEGVAEEVRNTGRGGFKLRANYRVDGQSIVITEIPYTSTREAIIESVIKLVKNNKVKDIVDINDNTGVNGLDITIDIKKNTDVDTLMAYLFKHTPLQSYFNCNLTMILDNKPVTMGTEMVIREWVKFRAKTIKRIAEFDLNKKESELHILKGLEKVLSDIDKAISIIRNSETDDDVVLNLTSEFNIDKNQADNVANIKLRNINKRFILNKIKNIEDINSEIKKLEEITKSKKAVAKIIISDLKRVKKNYGQDRKTKIIEVEDIPSVDINESMIEDYNVKFFITKDGYIKKIPLTSLRGNFSIKVKDDDEIIKEVELTNNSDVLVLTDKYNIYKYKAHELEDHKPSALGEYLPSLLGLKDEKILYTTVTNDYKGYLLVGFEDNKMAKIDLSAYKTKQNRLMLKNAYANKKALYFNHVYEDIDIMAISSIDKAIILNTSILNPKTSKTTIGSAFMKPKNDSVVSKYITIDKEFDNMKYFTSSNAGVGKYLKGKDKELREVYNI